MKSNPALRQLESYPFRLEILTRFSDTDPQHHINNVAIAEFYQEARIAFHRSFEREFERPKGSRVLVAHHAMDYLDEIHYPGALTIGVGIARIGTTSYTFAAAMFQNEKCVGLASTVIVNGGPDGPTPLPPQLRAVLERRKLLATSG
jgi:acyl-CoA thioester hydrolase